MQQIADASQIHKATLYHHFRHKEALFTAVVQSELKQLLVEMIEAIGEHSAVADRLVSVAWKLFSRNDAQFARLMKDAREHLSDDLRKE
jgi:AcrR family transcriptional regulator